MTRLLHAFTAAAIVALGCQGCLASPSALPTPDAAYPGLASPVEGVVVSVDSSGLTDVHGFVLLTWGQASVDFKLGILENATEFSPSHLREHLATSQPIRVYFRLENGQRVAYRIEDAMPPTT